ncbi:MAG: hypothetical protein DMG09_31055 [Acidobacteria bacterium]|nr:MAG: hypothetical protein DMG09_31055 [Acidobacteriota bacterium]
MLRAFAVKVQPRIHREAAKSAKISGRKILSCQQRIFGLVVQMNLARHSRNQKLGDSSCVRVFVYRPPPIHREDTKTRRITKRFRSASFLLITPSEGILREFL